MIEKSGSAERGVPSLIMPRDEARTLLREQIEKGKALHSRPISSDEDLENAWIAMRKWSDYNRLLLRRMSGGDELLSMYRLPRRFSSPMRPTLDYHVKTYRVDVRRYIGCLESIDGQWELIPDARPDETETNPPLLAIEIVDDTRGYVRSMMRQATGCYQRGWYDACAVMLRRLIEVLIVDSFEAKGKLDDILCGSTWPKFSEPPNAAEVERFLREVFVWMEDALHYVSIAYLHNSPPVKYAAAVNWETIKAGSADTPTEMDAAFREIMQVRQDARLDPRGVTGKRLTSAAEAIHRVLSFLAKEFPKAGVNVPSVQNGDILPLGRLIEKYLGAPAKYWHVERVARAGLKKIKRLGDLGAHGSYLQVKRHHLYDAKDQISVSIQKLVRTAYPHSSGPSGEGEGGGPWAGEAAVRGGAAWPTQGCG